MDKWAEIRRRVLVDGLGKRAACREYGIHYKTLKKILTHAEPPGYRRTVPRRPSALDPLLPVVHQILKDDTKEPRKQRHTAVRIFRRLRDEHGYTGGLTVVKDAVRAWRQRHAEVFVPLAHPPGEAQADFGEAEVILDGRPTKVAVFVMPLPYSDAIFCRAFPRECTEASLEGHRPGWTRRAARARPPARASHRPRSHLSTQVREIHGSIRSNFTIISYETLAFSRNLPDIVSHESTTPWHR